MVPATDLLLFAGAALLMVLSPGPNMIYLISRSICQGRKAGVISLFGVIAGFLVHMLAAAVGLTALFLAVPLAYDLLKWAGALYLGWLAGMASRETGRTLAFRGTATADRYALPPILHGLPDQRS
jgi:threonine/homoserine/homoserine lactone efflux protein